MNVLFFLKIGLHLGRGGVLRPDAGEQRLDLVRRERLGLRRVKYGQKQDGKQGKFGRHCYFKERSCHEVLCGEMNQAGRKAGNEIDQPAQVGKFFLFVCLESPALPLA